MYNTNFKHIRFEKKCLYLMAAGPSSYIDPWADQNLACKTREQVLILNSSESRERESP